MAKTNEELLKVTEKNYGAVQTTEFEVYDKYKEVNQTFIKVVKKNEKNLVTELEKHNSNEKDVLTKRKAVVVDLHKKDKEHKTDVQKRQVEAEKIYQESLKAAEQKYTTQYEKINADIKKINSENKKQNTLVLKKYDEDVATLEKNSVRINEKAVKDQKSLDQKIVDLKAKHEAKVSELNEKEHTKIAKLEEAGNQNDTKIKDAIASEQGKYEKKLADHKPVYEEELAEIDEDIQDTKNEFDTKYENIRTSADQRIAVREKHLNRAVQDNDTRSAKQHKKDIEKFRKEANKDLIVLNKTYDSDNQKKVEYRKKFIEENFQKLMAFEKEFIQIKEQKLLEIDGVLIQLAYDIANTKLEYERIQAEELNKFHIAFNDIKIKQSEAVRNQEIDLEIELDNKVKLEIEFNKVNNINNLRLEENLEMKAKDFRDSDIEKLNNDFLSKDVLDNETLRLENELAVAVLALGKDLEVNGEEQEIDLHQVQHARHTSSKNEFLKFQQSLVPLHSDRANKIAEFELLELNNRYDIKLKFVESKRKEVEGNNEQLVAKMDDVLAKERVYFEKHIETLAGDQKASLVEFEEAYLEELSLKREELNKLDPRQDKKQFRALTHEIEKMEQKHSQEVANKEAAISESVHAFENGLNAAINRHSVAKEEAKALFNNDLERLDKALDLLNSNKDAEIESSKTGNDNTLADVNDFVTKASSRNTLNTSENQTYLDARTQFQNDNIASIVSGFESEKENENNRFKSEVTNFATAKQNQLDETDQNFKLEEQNLEGFIKDTQAKVDGENSNAENLVQSQNSTTASNNQAIEQKCQAAIGESNNQLSSETSDFNESLSEISRKESDEKGNFDLEGKRIKREYDSRVKQELSNIDIQLTEDIRSIV